MTAASTRDRAHVAPERTSRSLVAVDGIDGSGKSVLGRWLAAGLAEANIATVTLAVDDFRRPVDFDRGDRSEADVYYDQYYDLPLLQECLTAFTSGRPSFDIPVFDSSAHSLNGRRSISFGDAKLAIVEGVFALRVAAVADFATLIYVLVSFDAARSRILKRDTARGRSHEDVDHRIAARYFPAQERYLRAFNPTARADVLIDHETLGAPRIIRLATDRLRATEGTELAQVLQSFATSPSVG